MALIDDDEIEEIRGKRFVDVLLFLGASDGLIEAEVNLEGLVHRAVGDFGHRLAEWLEVVRLGLVGEDVAIHQSVLAFQHWLDEMRFRPKPTVRESALIAPLSKARSNSEF